MSKRMAAIKKARSEKGKGGNNKAWYVDETKLADLGIKQYKAKEGTNYLRVIPPPDEEAYFGYKIFVHYDIGVNGDAFLCPAQMQKEPCPICERREELRAREADPDLIKALNAFPPRFLFWAVDMESEETAKDGVHLYDAPMTINDEIITHSENRRTGELVDISDPDEGKILIFDRVGKGRNTRYKGFQLDDDDPIKDEWLEVPEFEDVLVFASYEEMAKALGSKPSGASEETVEEDDDDRRPRRRRRSEDADEDEKPRRRRRPARDEDEEDDEDEKPRRRRAKKKDDEDEAEPETTEDDDGEEGSDDDEVSDDNPTRKKIRERIRKRRRS